VSDDGSLRSTADGLAGRYELIGELGTGGMAVVYLAHDRKHGRQVAIKILAPNVAASLGAERFLREIALREIALTAGLDHPHILPLLDSGGAGGMLYYVMPYVEGATLRELTVAFGARSLSAWR
jgi:serine/threonine-protein kinase